jgi:hypothetical protein
MTPSSTSCDTLPLVDFSVQVPGWLASPGHQVQALHLLWVLPPWNAVQAVAQSSRLWPVALAMA